MNRRQLLAGALSLGALAMSNLSFAGVGPKLRRALLSEAWERAVRAGEPLLVLVVPPDEVKWERGRRLGIFLNNATEVDLAHLARVQPAAATLDELSRLVPGVEQATDAWMVLVRVDQETPTFRTIVVPEPVVREQGQSFEDFVVEVSEREPGLGWEVLRQRYTLHQLEVGQGELPAVIESFRASVVRVLASEGLAPERRAVSRDAQTARQRWVDSAPPGTHWASSWGCGTSIEPNPGDDPDSLVTMVACGMGHVEPYAARFIHFWDVMA